MPVTAAATDQTETAESTAGEVKEIDLSNGRVEITDTGYVQYKGLTGEKTVSEEYTGAYRLTGSLDLQNTGTYKKTAVIISSAAGKTFDVTLENLSVTLTHSCGSSDQIFKGLLQVESGDLNLNAEGENDLTVKMTGSKQPSNPSIANGAPVIRVMNGDLTLGGSGTLTLNNQDESEKREFSGGIQVHAGSLRVDMKGILNIHLKNPVASHITCGELDYSNKNLPGMNEDDADQGNFEIANGTVSLGGISSSGALEPGTGIKAGRKLEITGGKVDVTAEKAALSAAAPRNGNFGSLIVAGAGTSVSVRNSVDKDYYRSVAVKENLVIEKGADLTINAEGAAKGVVVGETQASEPFAEIADCNLTINTTSDCMELFCSLTIDDGAQLNLQSEKANGIHNWIDSNRQNAYPVYIGDSNIVIDAKKAGIFYQVSNEGSKLEFGKEADLTIEKDSGVSVSGIQSTAEIIIGGNSRIDIEGMFSKGGIFSDKGISAEGDAFVKVMNRSLSADAIESKEKLTIDCKELIASGNKLLKRNGVSGDSVEINDMDYVPLEEDIYYSDELGERNHMFDAENKDTTAEMAGTRSSPYLHVKESALSIRPADITVYTGGDSYEGVVDGAGNISTGDRGLPEPGYLFTIPETVNNALGGKAEAEDLSSYLTFSYDDGNGITREWKVEKYSDSVSTTDLGDGIDRYVYRLLPDTESGIPVRLQFQNGDETVISDDFTFSAENLNETYTMSLYTGGLDPSKITAEFQNVPVEGGGENSFRYPVKIESGTLTVRGVTGTESETITIASDEAEIRGDTVAAVAPDDIRYYVNDSQVEITEKENVRLLTDRLLDTEVLKDYIDTMEAIPDGEYLFDMRYLDLVDSSNGNAVVTMGNEQKMTLYWPVPEDADTGDPFYIVHFNALDRSYGSVDDVGEILKNNPPELYRAADEENPLNLVTIGGKQYIKFAAGSFSPFVLLYEKKTSGGGGGDIYYTLTYDSNGGTEYASERYPSNTLVQLDKNPVREGYTFTGWYADRELTQSVGEIRMNSSKTVYAGWEATGIPDWLNGRDHFAYMIGYEDGRVKPVSNISRAEVATIFFRLLSPEIREKNLTVSNVFTDVNEEMWCNTAISTMAKLGVVKGRTEETFAPNAFITRAEFAAVCARFDTYKTEGDSDFTDISGHWAEAEIERAATLGWICGYEDGTFRPENPITRAEAMAMINRVLCRLPESESDLLESMHIWPDNEIGAWYYLTVQEATNSHDFERKEDGVHERWTALKEDPDWTRYEN